MAYRKLSKAPDGTKINRKPGMGGRNLSADTYAWNYNLPCRNPNCKSHGKPHPNCNCYGGGGEGDYAKGGEVHFCSSGMPHLPSCSYYAKGGETAPATHLGHAAAHHGLQGLLREVGRAKLADPEKHVKLLDEARHNIGLPSKTEGSRLGAHLSEGRYDSAAEMLHGHPMVGGAGKKDLEKIMSLVHQPMVSAQSNPEALKATIDYFYSAAKGENELKGHVDNILAPGKSKIEPDHDLRSSLDTHLKALASNPEALLEVGGNLGHYMPDHAAQLSAMASTAIGYFNSIRPMPTQMGPLDPVIPPDKASESAYYRQLDIAEQPLLVMRHVKDGTLLPQDIETVRVLYPGLHQSMLSKMGEALINAKQNGHAIPYKQRMTMSMFMEQPLDFSLTPEAMQAVIQSQAGQQAKQQENKGAPSKATDVELRQINKVNEMGETKLEKRQTRSQ